MNVPPPSAVPSHMVLIRHAAAAALADHAALADVTRIAHSPELKARQTAEAVARTRPLVQVRGLAELDRSSAGFLSGPEYVNLVSGIFAEPEHSIRGCEPAQHAQQRFISALASVRAQFPLDTLAIVAHGLVLALYLAHLRRLPTADVAAWQRIGLPDVAVVSPDDGVVMSDFGSLRVGP